MKNNEIESGLSKKKSRGRPRAFDPDQALDAAIELFWRKGYESTSLDDIVAATGIARPSLSAAFGDKVDIYLQSAQRFVGRMKVLFEQAAQQDAPVSKILTDFYLKAIEMYFSGAEAPRGCLVFCTATTPAAVEPRIRQVLQDVLKRGDAAFENLFAIGVSKGELPKDFDVKQRAQLATATMQTLGIRARAGEPKRQLIQLAKQGVSWLLA